jgi:mono/diheme cytochrome c family protein
MERAIPFWPIALAAAVLAMSQAQAQQIDRAKQGLIFAKQVCAQCHSVEKDAPYSPNPGAPRFEDIANTAGMTAMAISAALHTSHPTMPNVMLDSDELGNIVAYILSLQRTEK